MLHSMIGQLKWLAFNLSVLVWASFGCELALHFEAGTWDREAITRWMGTAVIVVGLVLAAPDGFMIYVSHAGPLARRARGWLARRLPFLRRDALTHVGTARGTFWANAGAVGTVSRNFATEQDTAHQLERLRLYVESLFAETERLDSKIDATKSELQAELAEMNRSWVASLTELRGEVHSLSTRAAAIDASALPVVALGTLLGGLAPELASRLSWPTLLVILLAVPVIVVLASRRHRFGA